jgi:ribosomal protein S18 acetylase RimI-like enzyme
MAITVHIKKAGAEDTEAIVSLSVATFRETYGSQNTEENILVHVQEHFNPEKIRSELNEPDFRFYLATIEGAPVGFMKLRSNRQPRGIAEKRCLEIQRIYVLQEYQGASVGSELVKLAKEIAQKEHFQVIWLQVWQKNEKAIRFYHKSGFVIYETTSFLLGKEMQADYLLRFDLFN